MASERFPPPGGEIRSPQRVPAARPVRRRRRTGKLRLKPRRPLADALLGSFRNVVKSARGAARRAPEQPAEAVHEFRKSLRRADAVVALLRPALGKKASRGLTRRLRDVFRTTGAVRDAEILVAALAAMPRSDEEEAGRRSLESELETRRAHALREAPAILEKAVAGLPRVTAAFEVLLDPDVGAHELESGLARSRRRERAALERARQSGASEDLHRWRKRIKELRYELELLASTGSPELEERERALADLARRLGSVTDAIALASAIERRRDESGLVETPVLLEKLRERIRQESGESLEKGPDLFEKGPRAFARRVVAERG